MTSRRLDIQGLRALAVIAVILDHVVGWPLGGFAGVDVFFVISGFLITGLLIRDAGRSTDGRPSMRRFYAMRMRRIAPAAVTVLVVTCATAWLLFNQPRFWSTVWDAVSAFFFVSNWRFAVEGTDYFQAQDAVSPLQHFWSLSVEEQFYLVWPLLVVLLLGVVGRRASPMRRRVLLGVALGVLGAASFGFALWQSAETPAVAYFSTLTRVWELAFGGLLAVAAPLVMRLPVAVRFVLGWAGLAGIVASLLLVDSSFAFPGPWAAPAVLATGAVVAAGVGGRQPWLFPLTNPVAGFIGDLSYSLYLWHFPVLVFTLLLLPEQTPAVTAVILGTTLAVALVSYFLIEQPLHRSPWLRGRELLAPPEAGRETGREREVGVEVEVEVEPQPRPQPRPEPEPVPTPVGEGSRGARPVAVPSGVRAPAAISDRTRAKALAAEAARAKARAEAAASSGPGARAEAATGGTRFGAGVRPGASAGEGRSAASASPVETLGDARRRAWAEWRERFSAQFLLAGLGLVAIVVVVAVTVQLSIKGDGPLAIEVPQGVPAAGLGGDSGPETDDGQPTANPEDAIQADLWAAASAAEWPSNLSPSMDAAISETSSRNPAKGCFEVGGTPDFGRCTWGDGNAPNHLYLVGDSTALAYAPAFKEIAEQSHGQWKVTAVGLYGCRFTDVLVQNDGSGVMDACPQRKADVAAQIASDSPQLVVVSNAYALGNGADRKPLTVNDLVASTMAQASHYDAAGRIVYLAPPPLGADLGTCYSPVKSPQDCNVGIDQTWNDFQKSFQAAVAGSGTGDHVVSSLGFTCVQGYCPAFAGTVPTRYDEVHMTPEYAVRVAASIRWELAAQGLM
ncbi:acyltransferase family protein [Herbiconiux sp. P18]|uniref:acyltransferase family protein n=1 Tax=Herbiconiux liangxiaofengii TaxID=3342795 RepID=UPI0035B79FFF